MGADIPLLNDYKKEFLKKRLPQTALGGLNLKLGYKAPAYVYLLQILLFVIPLILGATFTVLTEYGLLDYQIAIYAYGSLVLVFTLTTNLVSYFVRRKTSAITPLKNEKRNLCGEDEEVEFSGCCGAETVEFILPGRKHLLNVFLHSLLSGPVAGLGLWYLLPATLRDLYGTSTPAVVAVCVAGWLALTIGQYSLTSAGPPEWATFRATDPLELNMVSRPFHCLCFFAIFILARFFPLLVLTDQVLHGVFCVLPLLWLSGWLPPMDAFILWALEQAHVYLFGGSPMATDFWNVVYIVWTSVFFLIALMIPSGVVGLIACSCFGYFLSTDLSNLARNLALHCSCGRVQYTEQEVLYHNAGVGFLWTYGPLEFCLVYFLMLLVGGLTALVNYLVPAADKMSISSYLGYAIIALWAIQLVLAECQKVTVIGGMFRNILFPASAERMEPFLARKKKLYVLGIIRRIIVNFLGPFTMVAYMSMEVDWSGKELPWENNNNNTVRFWDVMSVSRGYRWIFQSTPCALLEFSLAHILKVALPSTDTIWLPIGLATQLLIIGLARDRLGHVINKLYFVIVLLVTNWMDNKQRRKSTRLTIILNFVFFPIVLLLILIAAIFAAPLLPIFTLPIFLLGYPRPIRSWPGAVGAAANVCEDTVYYEQCSPPLAMALRTACANGSLGDPTPGRHYLVRWQDRLMWVQVLERGYFYVKLSIKGLELQETSCHTAEAAQIDDIIERTFEREGGYKCCTRSLLNPFPLNTLRPYDAAAIMTYSDARNQLTGVIDSPEVLKSIGDQFMKTLVWVVVGQVYWNHRNKQEGRVNVDIYDLLDDDEDDDSRPASALGNGPRSRPSSGATKARVADGSDIKEREDKIPKKVVRVLSSRSVRGPSRSSVKSTWSDNDTDSVLDEPAGNRNVSLLTGTSSKNFNNRDFATKRTDYGAKNLSVSSDVGSVDDLLDELNTFGTPATNVNQHNNKSLGGLPAVDVNTYQKAPTKSLGGLQNFDAECKSEHSVNMTPPTHWREMPADQGTLRALLSQFPADWYKHVISFLKFKPRDGINSQKIANQIAGDDVLMKQLSQVIMGCYAAVNSCGDKGASHVYKVYRGHLPGSELAGWIEKNPDMYSLTIQAYRMAVKLGIDEAVLGPASSLEELHDYLDEYDRDWYIGVEGDRGWEECVVRNRPHCFSFTHDQVKNTYHSRVLSLQTTPVYVSSVNCESVRAQWANLNMELLYMTNDDDERYSIQAHPALLRNLTVQAADPPLGYPVYSSEPVSVPTL